MLTTLRVSEFAIIDDLELDFTAGFTVISGETGAGKSVLFDALGLLMGDRADSSQVRSGAARAEISAGFTLARLPAVNNWLKQHDLDGDEELLIRRTLNADGRSRAYINGSPVTLQQLNELGGLLMAIHGQHAHQNLLKPQEQLQLLDDSGVDESLIATVRDHYRRWRREKQTLDKLIAADAGDAQQLELLQFQIQELSTLETAAQSYQQSVTEHERLSHASDLLNLVQESETRLEGDEQASVLRHFNQLLQRLAPVKSLASELGEVHNMLLEARINVEESLSLLRHFSNSLEVNPAQLREQEQQLSQLHELARKHHCRPQDLPQQLAQLKQQLYTLEHLDEQRQQQQITVERSWADLALSARQLSQARQQQAQQLARQTQKLLRQLGMPQARFHIQLSDLAAERCSASGLDHCEFLFSANPGLPPAALRKIASGGELSRCALALMVASRNRSGPPTLVFDEVDAGVGGETAKSVGQLLSKVARGRQALCITHLAQVAAAANQHLQVSKQTRKKSTQIQWQLLNDGQRREELARMLGGAESDAAHAHALELLDYFRK